MKDGPSSTGNSAVHGAGNEIFIIATQQSRFCYVEQIGPNFFLEILASTNIKLHYLA